jgi:hypothetical protein
MRVSADENGPVRTSAGLDKIALRFRNAEIRLHHLRQSNIRIGMDQQALLVSITYIKLNPGIGRTESSQSKSSRQR